jgi:hypothetical protein
MIRNLIVLLSLLISTSVWSNTDEGIVASYIHTVNKNVDAHSIARRIVLYSTTYKVPLDWSVAVAQKESTFYTNAYYKGNFGVYQINRVDLPTFGKPTIPIENDIENYYVTTLYRNHPKTARGGSVLLLTSVFKMLY